MGDDCMRECVPAHAEVAERPTASSEFWRPGPERKGIRKCPRREELLTQGNIVFSYAKLYIGEAAISHARQSGERFRLPRGFWSACCKQCFNRKGSDALRKSLSKALYCYICSLRHGATTKCGMLGVAFPEQRRSNGDR